MNHTFNGQPVKKWTIVLVIDLLILGIVVSLFFIIKERYSSSVHIDGVYIEKPLKIPEFNLTDNRGHQFTKIQLGGHWTLVFFGFTNCPMICPTTFDALNQMYKLLQRKIPSNLLPQVVFISIDPDRDTIERLNQYVNHYNPHFIGARGDITKIKKFEQQLSISVSNINGSIAHSTDILLLNPKAKIQAYFLYPHRPIKMANDYVQIINHY
jgi:protein SCO1/2